MSVINQMLKDLEENKQNAVQVTPLASIAPSRSSKLVMILLMLLVTGLAVVAVYLFAEQLNHQNEALVSSAVVPVVTPQEQATTPGQVIVPVVPAAKPSLGAKPVSQPDLQRQPLKTARLTDESSAGTENMMISAPVTASAEISDPVTELPAPVTKTSVSAVVAEVAKTEATAVQAPAANLSADVTNATDDSFAIKPVQRSRKDQAERYFKQANDALLIGDTVQAKKQLVKILRLDKHHDQAREKLASLLYGEQRFNDAVKLLQQGLSVSPHYPNFRLMLARIYLQNNDKQQAYYYLKPLKPEVRENLDYYAMLAGLAQSLGDLAEAKAAYLQLTKYDANRAKWWLGLGISADKLQDQVLALKAYKQAQSMGQLSPASRRYINDRINQLEKY